MIDDAWFDGCYVRVETTDDGGAVLLIDGRPFGSYSEVRLSPELLCWLAARLAAASAALAD